MRVWRVPPGEAAGEEWCPLPCDGPGRAAARGVTVSERAAEWSSSWLGGNGEGVPPGLTLCMPQPHAGPLGPSCPWAAEGTTAPGCRALTGFRTWTFRVKSVRGHWAGGSALRGSLRCPVSGRLPFPVNSGLGTPALCLPLCRGDGAQPSLQVPGAPLREEDSPLLMALDSARHYQ